MQRLGYMCWCAVVVREVSSRLRTGSGRLASGPAACVGLTPMERAQQALQCKGAGLLLLKYVAGFVVRSKDRFT